MRIIRWMYTVPPRLRSLFRRHRVEQELEEELQFHLEQAVEDGLERGMTPDEARRAAMRSLEGLEQRKEECRDQWGVRTIDGVLQDVRYALRTLRKSPAFALVAIGSLALGIGANTAVFSLMDVLLIRPLAVAQPESLSLISLADMAHPDRPQYSFTYPLFLQLQQRNHAYSGVFAWWSRNVQTPEAGNMVFLRGVYASGNYFDALGMRPAIGTAFGPDDDHAAGGKNGPVAVISDAFWTRKYARNPAALGQAIVINGVPVTITGVMPAGFFGAQVGSAPDIWMPLNLVRTVGDDAKCLDSPSCWFLSVMGRLRPGITEERARADLRVISRASMEATLRPGMRADRKAGYLARIFAAEAGRAGSNPLRRQVGSPLRVLMGLVALVLLIACANLANLLTARASARFREVGVRLAMGAGRARIVRQFLTESMALAAAGAAGGWLFAVWSTRVLVDVLSTTDNPVQLDLHPDWRILFFSLTVTVAAGILFGVGPALRATRHGVAPALKERAFQVRGGEERIGLGRALLGIQVALSVVLLAAAGLFAGTLVRLMSVDMGFHPEGLTVISIADSHPPMEAEQAKRLFGRLMQRARTIPGVETATLIWPTPLTNSGWNDFFTIPGRPDLSEDQRLADISSVGTRFTRTMQVPLRAGRDFNDGDTAQSEKVALISENAARRWFPNGRALGSEIGLASSKSMVRIVGIVGNYRYFNLREEVPLTVYLPYTQNETHGYVAIRTNQPVNSTYAAFRAIVREEAPTIPIGTIRTMKQQVDESLSTERLTAYLSVFIGALALLLTSVGLYGTLAYSVARRTGEIGIRMALGAQRGSVVWLVVRKALAHTLVGVGAGVAVVLASSRVAKSLLYNVKPNDPATIGAAVGALLLVCAVAALLPARRASRMDPMQALREE